MATLCFFSIWGAASWHLHLARDESQMKKSTTSNVCHLGWALRHITFFKFSCDEEESAQKNGNNLIFCQTRGRGSRFSKQKSQIKKNRQLAMLVTQIRLRQISFSKCRCKEGDMENMLKNFCSASSLNTFGRRWFLFTLQTRTVGFVTLTSSERKAKITWKASLCKNS